jgi:hypothetical protein
LSRFVRLGAAPLLFAATTTLIGAAPKITPAKDIIGFTLGDDYQVANYTQITTLLKKWEVESDRLKVVSIGLTEEGRPQYMAIVTSAANQKKLDRYKSISQTLTRAEIPEAEARKLAKEGKSVVWIDGGLHATESVNSQSLAELVYDLISKDDEETQQILDSTIAILPWANPDGLELVADWYARNPDKTKRSFQGLPRLYEKYAGHDNNRDSIIHNLKETVNQNRVLYIEWNPQLMINHHQSGPAGTIVFIPPFRDPYNYHYDPLIPLGIQQAGAALHARLVSKGLGGSVSRSLAPYSTWANGGIRYATYFRNQIGLMTEIFGSPTPSVVPLVADRQLANGDGSLPVRPGLWHYRQSIDYQLEINRGLLVYAAVNREQLLFNIYIMGHNSIERGSRDSWTITPKRIDALKAAAKALGVDPAGGRGRGAGAGADVAATGAGADASPVGAAAADAGDTPGGDGGGGFRTRGLPVELYEKVLHDPAFRDPRGYIISADQEDFPTAVKFVNALLKGGVYVHKATAAFEVNGKKYPAGSYVVKAAQAYRPVVLDSFEPLDHPTDLEYPGGPPKRPYDITGWTLAAQLAVQFDRVYEDFNGPFQRLSFDLEKPPVAAINGPTKPAGYLISHRLNDAFIVTNRLLKAGAEVYWLKDEQTIDGQSFAPGAIWVPASDKAQAIVAQGARDIGVPALAVAQKPTGEAIKLQPVRIGLVDVYGGSIPSGWTRWIFEKYEFPFEVVYPPALDAGNLKAKFDVIVLASGIYSEGRGGGGRGALGGVAAAGGATGTDAAGAVAGGEAAPAAAAAGGRGGFGRIDPATIPEEYRDRLGAVTLAKTVPALKAFVEAGGNLVAVGTSSWIGKALGLPLKDHLVEKDADGKEKHLSPAKFYVPGSVLTASFNPKNPLAYGLTEKGYVFFQDSPTFARPENLGVPAERVAWFDDATPLYSGWALGQEYLRGGELATEATLGKGKLALIGLEATFRATPQGTFKLLFNGVYFGSGIPTVGL